MPERFFREVKKLGALRRVTFHGKSLVILVGVALAALFFWLPAPDASDIKPASQMAVPELVKFSAYEEAAIKRRAQARVQRLLRLAQKSKDSKKKSEPKKAAPKKAAPKKAAPKKAAPKKAAPKKAAPKKAAPKKAAPKKAEPKKVAPKKAAPKKTAPKKKASPPPVQTTPAVPSPPVQMTPAIPRPPVPTPEQQQQENKEFCGQNPNDPSCSKEPAPPAGDKTGPSTEQLNADYCAKYPGDPKCSKEQPPPATPPGLVQPPGGAGSVPGLCQQNPQLPQCQTGPPDAGTDREPPSIPPGSDSPIPPNPPPSGESGEPAPTIQVVEDCPTGQVAWGTTCLEPGNCPNGQLQNRDYSTDPPQTICVDSCPDDQYEAAGKCYGSHACKTIGGFMHEGQCLEQCPDGLYGWNEYQAQCVERCPGNTGLSPDGICTPCPDGQVSADNQCFTDTSCAGGAGTLVNDECQCNEPTFVSNPDTNSADLCVACNGAVYNGQCVDSCPEGTHWEDRYCVPGCAEGAQLVDGQCVTGPVCNEGQLQREKSDGSFECVDRDECLDDSFMVERDGFCVGWSYCVNNGGAIVDRVCLEQCPEGLVVQSDGACERCPYATATDPAIGSDGSCLGPCPSGTIREGDVCVSGCTGEDILFAGQCLPPVNCPEGQLQQSSEEGYICVDAAECRESSVRVEWVGRCVGNSVCINQGGVLSEGKCVEACSEPRTQVGNACTLGCEPGEYESGDQCVSECPAGQEPYGKSCVNACADGEERIQGVCSPPEPAYNPPYDEFIEQCADSISSNDNSLVGVDPELIGSTNEETCQNVVDSGCQNSDTFFGNTPVSESRVCTERPCPDGQENVSGQCLNACAEGDERGPDGLCPGECPADQVKDEGGQCVACATGFEPAEGQCVMACPDGFDENGRCTTCPASQSLRPDGGCGSCQPALDGICLQSCPEGSLQHEGRCQQLDSCPEGTVRNAGGYASFCTEECRGGHEIQTPDGPHCRASCHPSAETVDGECVAPCPVGETRGSDGQCSNPCSDGQLHLGGQCRDPAACPDGLTLYSTGSCTNADCGSSVMLNGICVGIPDTREDAVEACMESGYLGVDSPDQASCEAAVADDCAEELSNPWRAIPPRCMGTGDDLPPADGQQPPAEGQQPPAEDQQPPPGDQQPQPDTGEQTGGTTCPDGFVPYSVNVNGQLQNSCRPAPGETQPPPDGTQPPPDSGTPPPDTGQPPPLPGMDIQPKPPAPGKVKKKPSAETLSAYRNRTARQRPLAIVIASARYSSKVIKNSKHAIGGAEVFKKFLKEDMKLPASRIITLQNRRLKDYVSLFGAPGSSAGSLQKTLAAAPASEVIIYYSGRAMPVEGGKDAVLLPRDAKFKQPVKTGYRLSQIYRKLHALGVQHLRFYLDTAFSTPMNAQPAANAPRPGLVQTRPMIGLLGMFTPKGWVVMSAGTGTQPTYADPKKPSSAFTDALLTGLRGLADTTGAGNKDGAVTAGELVPFIRNQLDVTVQSATRGSQRPSFFGRETEILFAGSIAPAPPAPVAPADAPQSGAVKPSFNCAKAFAKAEKAICANPAIATLDNVMVGLYKKARAARKGAARNALTAQQKQWLKQRNACGSDVACLAQRYGERIGQLQ